MRPEGVDLHDVTFAYDTAAGPIIQGFSCRFPAGWTGIVGVNGSGKSTLLKLATGLVAPRSGLVRSPGAAVYCEQRTDEIPASFEELLRASDHEACRIKGGLCIRSDWADRWETLSHGERKRAQIGSILWRRPLVLAVDEPTNHLDVEAREMLAKALKAFQGIGLLVSHDRELMDAICLQCLFMDPPLARMRPGGFTKGSREEAREEDHLRKEREKAKSAVKRLEREAGRRMHSASQSDRRRSKRGLARKDHDAREKIDRARTTGKDGAAGRNLRRLQGRLRRVRDKLDSVKVKKNHVMGIWLPGVRSRRNTLFRFEAGSLPLDADRALDYPELEMGPADRVALTGPNGAGKSTLIRRIVDSLSLPVERLTYVPQEIDLDASENILARARGLPNEKLGILMNAVSRLGSRPERLLESEEPSPGETRKLLLALGIAQTPHLIIMDEPTNHMDLASLQSLEDALMDCPCGLLLVSHDRTFLERLTRERWHIARNAGTGRYRLSKGGWKK